MQGINKQTNLTNHNILTKSERNYFRDLFNELKEPSSNVISFDNFKDIVYSSKRISRSTLSDQINVIKKNIETKKEIASKAIFFSKH